MLKYCKIFRTKRSAQISVLVRKGLGGEPPPHIAVSCGLLRCLAVHRLSDKEHIIINNHSNGQNLGFVCYN